MRIGIIGVGTVGSGVIEIIRKRAALWNAEGLEITIARICAKTTEELAPFVSLGYPVTTQVQELLDDPEIDVVAELAGGYDLPRQWILAALEKGKHVVTANKALIAKYGHEIFPVAQRQNCHVLYEAAVGGGIPIIRAIQESMTGNEVQHLSCIINGTCNYILTQMTEEGVAYQDVLAQAQSLGYAEADPTFDVEGIDSAHKLAILASLCSGHYVSFEKIHVQGISQITSEDIQIARDLNGTIKLLGTYEKHGDRVDARVHPTIVPNHHLLANVNGVLNAVYLETDHLGPTLQTGAGAGRLPTASAVVADLVFLARGLTGNRKPLPMGWFSEENAAQLVPIEELSTRYCFRFTTRDACGVLAAITKILSEHEISIESIVQKNVKDPGKVSIVVVTEQTLELKAQKVLNQIDALDAVTEPSRVIRFLV